VCFVYVGVFLNCVKLGEYWIVELPRRVCMAVRVLLQGGRAGQNRAVRHLRAEDDASGCGGDCSCQAAVATHCAIRRRAGR
jgi:hypothetical protein